MQAGLMLTTNHGINVTDISSDFGEPRIRDLSLAEALELSNKHDLRTLIRRHQAALKTFGELVSRKDEKRPQGGRPGVSFFLNKKQAIFITAKSDTHRAAEMTVQMVEVFDAYLSSGTIPVRAHARAKPLPKPRIDLEPGRYIISVNKDGGMTNSERITPDMLIMNRVKWEKIWSAIHDGPAPTQLVAF